PPPQPDLAAAAPMRVHDTPDTPTIEALVAYANEHALGGRRDWTAADTLKNVAVEVRGPGAPEPELMVIGVPGDREVDLRRLAAVLHPAEVTLFEDWPARPDLVRGYLGPQDLAKRGVRYLVDPRVVPGTAWLTGANEPGRHATGVVCGRDLTPDGTIEAATVRDGDGWRACGHGDLESRPGMRLGQGFQHGRRNCATCAPTARGPSGSPVRPVMGCYALGNSRVLAGVVEQHHVSAGIV